MNWVERILISLVGLLTFALCLICFDCSIGHSIYEQGTVYEKIFSPGKTGTGVGPTVGNNGGVAVVFTSTSDEWHILVKTKTDLVDTETSKGKWIELKIGEVVTVKHWIGGISKGIFYSKIK